MALNLHSDITFKESDKPQEDGDTAYNDKVVHAEVTFNEYTKPGGAGSIDSGTLEELQILVAGAKKAANTAVAASEDAALSRNASQANADSASTSATAAQNSAGRAESAAIRAEEAAERAEQAGSGGGSSSGGALDEETLQQIHDLVDEAKTAATNASGTLPVANGGTGVTSLDELKTALGITDPGTGGGGSSGEVFELTEVTTFDFNNPTPGQYMTTLANMSNAPGEWDMAEAASGDWAAWTTTQGILVRCWKANIPGYKGGYYADFIRFPIEALNKTASMGSGSGSLRVVRGIAYYKTASAASLTWQFRNDAW